MCEQNEASTHEANQMRKAAASDRLEQNRLMTNSEAKQAGTSTETTDPRRLSKALYLDVQENSAASQRYAQEANDNRRLAVLLERNPEVGETVLLMKKLRFI